MPKVRLAINDKDMRNCMKLRREVFIYEQNVPEELEVDGEDGDCLHVIAEENGIPVGTARFRQVEDSIKVQRVCVPKTARGTGLGARLMHFIIDHGKISTNAKNVKLSSQTSAIPFYEKLGFVSYGDEYIDAGIPHKDMVLKL